MFVMVERNAVAKQNRMFAERNMSGFAQSEILIQLKSLLEVEYSDASLPRHHYVRYDYLVRAAERNNQILNCPTEG